MESIASVLRPKFWPNTLVDAINDACNSLISIINVRRQELIELIKVCEQELANTKTCKDWAYLEFIEADRLYDTLSSPWYAPKIIPASYETILFKSAYDKERLTCGEFKFTVNCDKDTFRTTLKQITDVYLEFFNPQQHGIIGTGAKGSRVGEYNQPRFIVWIDMTIL